MAAVVYGGSPRQHNRITGGHHLHSNQNVPPPVPTHHYGIHHSTSSSVAHPLLPPPTSYQNLPPPPSTNLIIMPPPLYMTSETTTMSTTSQYHQYSSSHDQQPLSLPPLPPTPTHSHHYHQQFQHHSSVMFRQNNTKRKSAVEMLAESKPFYVKSENVLDRSQHLHFRSLSGGFGVCTSSAISSTQSANNYLSMEPQLPQQSRLSSTLISPSRLHNSHQNRIANRRSASTSSDLLQTKLRKLLNADSKDSDYQYNPSQHSDYLNSSSKDCDIIEHQSNKISVSDLSLTLLSPPPNSDEEYYPPDVPLLTEDFSTISPPAEYACNSNEASPIKEPPKNRSNYQRSYSNSHESQPSDEHDYSSTSCHKSLPDLHSQIGVTNRHSPHSEVLSCCSRGNRSNKSGGSSLNRDSGGSSGHYTHRSDPCCKQVQIRQQSHHHNPPHQAHDRHYSEYYRRDSGSSTQHSGNSYYVSGRPDCAECLLNFTTPEVPEAFQDDYPTITRVHRNSNNQDISPPPGTFKRQKCLRIKHQEEQYEATQAGNGKPILRSKSDISDRYWRNCQPPPQAALPSPSHNDKILRKSESLSQLEIFFDRLGLDDDKFNEIYSTPKRKTSTGSDSSDTVFFSDVSTIDSLKLAADNTSENQTQTTPPIYRPSEPTSIVERNARIIKWLCNCRKMQAAV